MNTSRVQRIVKLLTALHSGSALSVDDLSRELDVTRRTIFRDLSILENAGVPFQYDRTAKRYRIRQDYFVPPISFSLQECLAMLFMSRKMLQTDLAPDFPAAVRAAVKLESALPHDLREHCLGIVDKMDLTMPPMSSADGHRDHFEKLQLATVQQRKVQINYEPPDKPAFEDRLHPLHLAFINRGWYVISHSEREQAVRTFKIERMAECRLLEEHFVVDEPFSLAEYYGDAWQMIRGDQRHHVKLKFTRQVATNVEEVLWHRTQQTLRCADDSLIFEVDVDGINELSWWILGYGDQVEVLEPPELRELIGERAGRMCGIYAGSA